METWQDKRAVERGQEMLQHASIFLCYVNYKGRDGTMNIKPLELVYAKDDWHPHEQWLLRAINTDRRVERFYVLKDVLWWRCTDKHCTMKCKLAQWTNDANEVNEIRMEQFKAAERASF